MKILVTGGAGYIGSICTRFLLNESHTVVVFDNLETGHADALPAEVPLVRGDLRVLRKIESVLVGGQFDVVMHFAASIDVAESMRCPEKYYYNNVYGGMNLLEAMRRGGCRQLVFSSTAATYGQPAEVPIRETTITNPTNPYGESKLAFEKMLPWHERAHGLRWVVLRYFNACGALSDAGERHNPETHLIPNILRVALGLGDESVQVFGGDYDTKDGTPVRDFVHVSDLARAHVLALRQLQQDSTIYNLGHGVGYTVREVIEAARHITGHPIPEQTIARRAGDPPVLVAAPDRIYKDWGWKAQDSSLEKIIGSAWDWHQKNGTLRLTQATT